jgi:hypothetical protein
LSQKFFPALFHMIWGVARLRPNFFSSGRIFWAELAQESWRDLAAVEGSPAAPLMGGGPVFSAACSPLPSSPLPLPTYGAVPPPLQPAYINKHSP